MKVYDEKWSFLKFTERTRTIIILLGTWTLSSSLKIYPVVFFVENEKVIKNEKNTEKKSKYRNKCCSLVCCASLFCSKSDEPTRTASSGDSTELQ